MTEHLYRVGIVSQPEWEERWCFDTNHEGERVEGYWPCPVDWVPSDEYVDHFNTNKWVEPALDKAWRSRSSAASRRDILNEAGYLAFVQRSAPIVWPEEGQERVNDSETAQVAKAIRVLKRAGLIKSADEILK